MIRLANVIIAAALVATASSLGSAQIPTYRAEVALQHAMRDMNVYIDERHSVRMELSVRDGRATLAVRGRYSIRAVELAPGEPSARVHLDRESDVEQDWTGAARREGSGWLLELDHVTGRPSPLSPPFEWRCEPTDAEVSSRTQRLLRCQAATPIPWGPPGSPVPSYFRVPIHFGAARAGAGVARGATIENRIEGGYQREPRIELQAR